MRRLAAASSSFALALACAACITDPVPQAEIDAILAGGEEPPNGGQHYFDKPCLACHGEYGGAEPKLSVAGTLRLRDVGDGSPQQVRVQIAESSSSRALNDCFTITGGIGNFFFDKPPTYPLAVRAGADSMRTLIGRDGSCARCHEAEPSATSPGPILVDPGPAGDCAQ